MRAIGVDPGTTTGVAIWNADAWSFEVVTSTGIITAMQLVLDKALSCNAGELIVIVEDARQRKGGFKKTDELTEKYGAAVRESVGSVKRDCSIWEEFLQHYKIPYEMRYPHSTNTQQAEFARLAGWSEITNEHARDAAMLVLQLNTPVLSLKLRTYEERRARGFESKLSARTRVRRADRPRYNARR